MSSPFDPSAELKAEKLRTKGEEASSVVEGRPFDEAQGRPRKVERIAHAYGNRRESIEEALAADVDTVEADVCYRAGELWVRHERRLGPIPLLYDRRPRGVRRIGPWALPLGFRYYLRLDIRPLTLRELMEHVKGQRRLLLDVKGGYSRTGDEAYARRLGVLVGEFDYWDGVTVCGQNWSVVREVRESVPRVAVRYSIETGEQWSRFLGLLGKGYLIHGICIDGRFLDEERARLLRERGIGFYVWTVDEASEARRVLGLGAEGVISNDLVLLKALGEATG